MKAILLPSLIICVLEDFTPVLAFSDPTLPSFYIWRDKLFSKHIQGDEDFWIYKQVASVCFLAPNPNKGDIDTYPLACHRLYIFQGKYKNEESVAVLPKILDKVRLARLKIDSRKSVSEQLDELTAHFQKGIDFDDG